MSQTDRATRPRPDYPSRELDDLAYQFDYFGEEECTQLDAELYRALCRGIRGDRELLALAAHAPSSQPPPNLLFAAVHYLLLGGTEHRLRAWYPSLATGTARPSDGAFEPFREFCLDHREEIVPVVAGRRVQTNVVQRTSGLLPAFARVFEDGGGAPLAQIEIGCSAGLNLQWTRFRYEYSTGLAWGDPASGVVIECELRGEGVPALPTPPGGPESLPVAWRRGIDLDPVDVADPDAVRWLRALVWPEHLGRQERLTAAIEIARQDPPEILAGDASRALPGLIEQAPTGCTVCVYGTHTLYQFPRDALIATFRALEAASQARPLRFISIEGTGDRCSELHDTSYERGRRRTELVARCNPHGRWLEWLAGGAP